MINFQFKNTTQIKKIAGTFLMAFICMYALTGCRSSDQSNENDIAAQGENLPLPFYNTPKFTPEWISTSDPRYDSIHTIDTFTFTNQHGMNITKKSVEGKILITNFFFTICPGICPKMMGNMEILQKEFSNDTDIALLSHSVTPWMDSVSVLKEYAVRNDITAPNWHLLTGSKEAIYTIARGSYFADEGFGKNITLEDDFLHTENVVLVDPQGRLRGVYSGTLPLQMRKLIEDVNTLRKEIASSQKQQP